MVNLQVAALSRTSQMTIVCTTCHATLAGSSLDLATPADRRCHSCQGGNFVVVITTEDSAVAPFYPVRPPGRG